jgi:bifunctional non-homologous end joining protein LigD
MLAVAAALPDGPGWSFEFKWDGMRALVDCVPARSAAGPGSVRIHSRNENDVTEAYPEIVSMLRDEATPDALFDGEIVAFDGGGRPSFEQLQRRMHVRGAGVRALAAEVPVTYLMFDILRLHGVDLAERPLVERRATLERLAADRPGWVLSPAFDDGDATIAAARQNGLEGVVAKRLISRYRPGARTPDWVKVPFRRTQECVVLGWEAGEGNRERSLGSLLLGVADPAAATGWRYVGQAGSGLSDLALATLSSRLRPLRQPGPATEVPIERGQRAVTWVRPEVVVEVEYGSVTSEGVLRHPVFRGIRADKAPDEAVWAAVPDEPRSRADDTGGGL